MDTEQKRIEFKLQGIKTEQFAILEENFSSEKEISLAANLQFKINSKNKQMGVFLGFEFIQEKTVLLKIIVSCHFKIEDLAWNSLIDEDKIIFPKDFLAHLAMITTGTARGVLFAKTEDTPFAKYIIPTLNVAELVEKDVSFYTEI